MWLCVFQSEEVHVHLWKLWHADDVLFKRRFRGTEHFSTFIPLSSEISCLLSFPIFILAMSSVHNFAFKYRLSITPSSSSHIYLLYVHPQLVVHISTIILLRLRSLSVMYDIPSLGNSSLLIANLASLCTKIPCLISLLFHYPLRIFGCCFSATVALLNVCSLSRSEICFFALSVDLYLWR
jgi:hypothetical protein